MDYKRLLSKTISINVSFLLLLQQSVIAGEIVTDINANSSFKATVEKAPNNVPVVNIVKPNDKGLSHNKFSDYNVNKEGVILNNSNQKEVNTQLAGYIYGNKNLAGGSTASTILNEVTSRNKTELKGFTEVAGDKAKIVIANQNGIYINAAGFINTQKATITTGAINLQNGNIESYRVDKGEIQIDEEGLNTTNVDKTELYSKVVKLNAQIHSKDIDIVTGKNSISSDGSINKIDEADESKPEVSLDSSSLGGIYANKITLIGTQDGVGVNLPIEINAQDELKLNADGKISLDKVISNKNLEIKSNSNDINSNVIYANSVSVEAKNEINNKDILASKTDINLKAKTIINENLIASGVNEDLSDSISGSTNIESSKLENKKTLYSKEDLVIDSKDINNTNGIIVSSENLNINSQEEGLFYNEKGVLKAGKNLVLNTSNFQGNESNILANDIKINANEVFANSSNLLARNGDIKLEANNMELSKTLINASKELNLFAFMDVKAQDVNIQANKIDIVSDNLILSNENTNTQDYNSKLISQTTLDINANSVKNVNGHLGASQSITINSLDFQGDNSNIQAKDVNINSNNFRARNSSIIGTQDNLTINSSGNVDLTNSSQIAAKNNLHIKGSTVTLDNTNTFSKDGNLTLNATTLNTKNSKLTTNKDLSITSNDIKNVDGYIESLGTIVINSQNLDNTSGVIVSKGDLTINETFSNYGVLNNTNGLVQSLNNNIFIKAFNLTGENSQINAKKYIDIFSNSLSGNLTAISKDNNLLISTLGDINLTSSYLKSQNGLLSLNSNQNNTTLTNTAVIGQNIILSGNNITTNGSLQSNGNDNMLYSLDEININANTYNGINTTIQGNDDINITVPNITLDGVTLQSVIENLDISTQGNINLITSFLNILNASNLSSKDLNIKNISDTKLEKFVVKDSTLDANNDINILSKLFNTISSKFTTLRNLSLDANSIKDNQDILFNNSAFESAGALSVTLDEDVTLSKGNSFDSLGNIVLNIKSLLNAAQFRAKDNITVNSDDYIINDGFISGSKTLTINAKDVVNKGGIAVVDLSAEQSKDSVMTINANNLTNYNTIFANADINLNIKNQLLNKTDNDVVDLGNAQATIHAVNNLNIGSESLRTDSVINDKSIIQTKDADINIFADSLENKNDEIKINNKNNANESYVFYTNNKELFLEYDYYSWSDDQSSGSEFYSTIGEQSIISKLQQEDILKGKYYNSTAIGNSCHEKIKNNCFNLQENSVIINNISYDKSLITYEIETISDSEGNSSNIWHIKYKDKSTNADNLIRYSYEISIDRVLKELENKYVNFSNILVPKYKESARDDRRFFRYYPSYYYLEIIDDSYYRNNAIKYNFNYSSTIDYFEKKSDIEEGGKLYSGRNMKFDVSNINNDLSHISATADIQFINTKLNNQSRTLYQYDKFTGSYYWMHDSGGNMFSGDKPGYTTTQLNTKESQKMIDILNSKVEAGGIIGGSFIEINNENKARDSVQNIEFNTFTPNQSLTNTKIDLNDQIKEIEEISQNEKSIASQEIDTKILPTLEPQKEVIISNPIDETFELPTNPYGVFTAVSPNKTQNYLVESNPLYTNLSNFIGSQYFLDKMNYQGDRIVKRLGDAGYETKLISDSIVKQTGQRFLNAEYTSENVQFVALMDSAINLSGILGLEVGKALSSEQLANLSEDIVWMEEKIVAGQKVLVPVVYLAKDYEYLKGATITAKKGIDLNVKNSLNNSGTIKSNNYLNLNANSIINNQGIILANGKASLISTDDFVNKNGGLIKASEVQIASINANIINQTFAQTNKIQQGSNDFTYTLLGKQSNIQSTNGNLILQAKNNIDNIGSKLEASKTLSLTTQIGDINLKTLSLENGHNVNYSGGFNKALDVEHLKATASAGENVIMNSGNNINLEASKLNAINQINLNAANDVNITAVNDVHYTDVQTSKKGTFSKKTQRDMVYKEEVNSAQLNANDIYMTSGNDINLEAVNINAKNEKIAHAQNSLNILAKTYKEGELHSTSKSSFGGMIKNEYKYEKDNLKIKSSEISSSNMILDAKIINVEASKLKANQIEISTDILNMISSKESLYENEFSNKGGIITATIENKGKIEEIVIPSTIEVNDKLIFNKKDITDKLDTNELIKTLSSQGSLTQEQINLVKQIANSKEWHDKTTTLSGMGALIITAIVTYFTAGAGAGIAGSLSGATAAGASATATQLATQAAVQAVIQSVATQASVQLASSAITGNKLKLDLNSIAKSAVTAGVLNYANGLVNGIDNLDKVTKTVTNTTIQSGVQSVVFKTDFKDTLVSNLAMAGTNLAFENVGDYEVSKLKQGDTSWSDGSLNKTVTHALVGGTVSAIQNKDILSGALSAGVREALSPLTVNSEEKTQLLASQLTGIFVGGIVAGEEGANNGYIISTSGEMYNRQLHQDEIKKINAQIDDFSNKTGLSKEKSLELLTLAGNMLVDENVYNEYTNSTKYIGVDLLTKDVENAMNYLKTNSQGKTFLDMPTQQRQEYFTSQEYMYKNSEWNPNIKEFYYVPTYTSQSNEILANQITQQTWYERQKGAEERFDVMVTSGGYLVDYGVESKNPLLIKIGTGLKYGSTTMKYLVTPDEIKDYQIYNEIVPKLFQVEPAEGETK